MVGTKITRQTDERINSQMVSTRNNSAEGWTDGELNGRDKNNSPEGGKDGVLNGLHSTLTY